MKLSIFTVEKKSLYFARACPHNATKHTQILGHDYDRSRIALISQFKRFDFALKPQISQYQQDRLSFINV